MAENKNIGAYNPQKVEEEVLKFWKDNSILEKKREFNKGKKKFFFIQGPPYTSGEIHIAHAWNNSLKDIILRHRRMKGMDVFDRAAYDMHGLPTERKVMAKHNFRYKEEILEYGLEKFNKECMDFSHEKAMKMNVDLTRLGVSMDFENARLPIDNSYIEGEWFLIKQTHNSGRLYEGLRTMTWCAECATAMAKHECEYKQVTDTSIFLKFPVKDKENEYLVIWTTTPWTIAFNLAIMVHPELEYVKAKVDDEVWIIAKGLAAPVVQTVAGKELKVLDEFPGKDLEGLEYVHPWRDEIKQLIEIKEKHPKTHTVILSEEFVTLSAGSGLVHCAPGCGPEDYEVGHRNNIPPFNNLDEKGVYPDDMGKFSGLKARDDDKKFIEELEKTGLLIAKTPVEHDYAHCERCHNPVIFRTTKQWFFKVEDLKQKMIEGCEKIKWVPQSGGDAFKAWLENLRDNSITKQRFWGTPAPIWRCAECGKYEVIGSADELKAKAGHLPDNLHKPWIDDVEISCECGSMMKRIPDVLDVWLDAGTLSWNILDYPKKKELFEALWPADFVLEAKEQVRLWFNMLMVTSIMALDDNLPFKACYMHGMLTDVEGVKMSKSLGNIISPYELIDKHGADTLRYYMCEINAGEDINFSWDEAKLRQRYLTVFWNMHKYLIQLCRLNNVTPSEIKSKDDNLDIEEKYILSKLHSTIQKVTELLDGYRIDNSIPLMTELMLEISRTYIQLTRDKSSASDENQRIKVINTLYNCLLRLLEIQAPITPFICEGMYQNFRSEFKLEEESIQHRAWPSFDESFIDKELEKKMDFAQNFTQSVLAAREKMQIGVRWPLKEVIFVPRKPEYRDYLDEMSNLIKTQANVKKIIVNEGEVEGVTKRLRPDFAKLSPEFGEEISAKLIAHISTTSMNSILNKIENEGKYSALIDGTNYDITKEHFNIDFKLPEHLATAECRFGEIYADKTRTKELDAEGFARELIRRVQAARKNAGLSKEDVIDLFVKVDDELNEMLSNWVDHIKEKVGADSIAIGTDDLPETEHSSEEKVKGKQFLIGLNKK